MTSSRSLEDDLSLILGKKICILSCMGQAGLPMPAFNGQAVDVFLPTEWLTGLQASVQSQKIMQKSHYSLTLWQSINGNYNCPGKCSILYRTL